MQLIWKKIDELHVDVLYYAFVVSIVVFFCFLPFSIKEAFNFLMFAGLCFIFHKILKSNEIGILDENVF